MNEPTDWTTALVILAAGLILGIVFFVASKRRKVSGTNKRLELEARRDALVGQLRDLGDDVAGVDVADDERAWLETETAQVLRALDRYPASEVTPVAAPPARRSSATSGFVWGMACTAILGGIVLYGSSFARQRDAAPPPMAAESMAAVAMPPVAMPPVMTPPAASAGVAQPVTIMLSLDPRSTVRSGIVYVMARGASGGHPIAVKRIEATAFPMAIAFGADDAMMGQPLPATMRIEARLDSDGDAGTTDPADLRAFADGVTPGASIELALAKAD
jgi:hypothetical protein